MLGQWYGGYNGSSSGGILLNIELINGKFSGRMLITEKGFGPRSFTSKIEIVFSKNDSMEIKTFDFIPTDPKTCLPIFDKKKQQEIMRTTGIPRYGILLASKKNNPGNAGPKLEGTLQLDSSETYSITLGLSQAMQPSLLRSSKKNWKEFDEFVTNNKSSDYIFRGQNTTERLRTLYHRLGRCDLIRYCSEDIPLLRKNICGVLQKNFNVNDPWEYGSMLCLAQHHGYPTPLLDWSESPYIATYFAFRNAPAKQDLDNAHVRIFVLNKTLWEQTRPKPKTPIPDITTTYPVITIHNFLPIENPRLIPQKASSLFSNMDDIEGYIDMYQPDEKNILTAIDIPLSARKEILSELDYRGINDAMLFPGLDGTCKMLKEKYFSVD